MPDSAIHAKLYIQVREIPNRDINLQNGRINTTKYQVYIQFSTRKFWKLRSDEKFYEFSFALTKL